MIEATQMRRTIGPVGPTTPGRETAHLRHRPQKVFHAPRYWWSAGGGWLELSSEDGNKQRHITYVRANLLAKRWNLPGAQANVSLWGGHGNATGNDFDGSQLAMTCSLPSAHLRASATGQLGTGRSHC